MKKIKLGKNALLLAVTTLVTVLVWMTFEVYQARNKNTIPQVTQEQMRSLNPKLKTDILEGLKNDLTFSEKD